MDKKECLEMIRCKTCVYFTPNSIIEECGLLGSLTAVDIEKFGCTYHTDKNEYRGSCYTCEHSYFNSRENVIVCHKECPNEYIKDDDIFKIRDCYAYSKDKFLRYPYPNRIPNTNKVKIKPSLPVSSLLGSLMLINFKEEIIIDNSLNYCVYFTDFYKYNEYKTSTYENYKKDFEYIILDHLLNIEEELDIDIDFDVWVKGLIEYVKNNQYSIIDLLNKFCSPTYLLLYLTKKWIKEKRS